MKRTGLMDALAAANPTAAKTADRPAKRSKRSDPNYMQICMLVPKNVYHEVRRRLIGTEIDASDLVGSLLAEWLDRSRSPDAETRGKRKPA